MCNTGAILINLLVASTDLDYNLWLATGMPERTGCGAWIGDSDDLRTHCAVTFPAVGRVCTGGRQYATAHAGYRRTYGHHQGPRLHAGRQSHHLGWRRQGCSNLGLARGQDGAHHSRTDWTRPRG